MSILKSAHALSDALAAQVRPQASMQSGQRSMGNCFRVVIKTGREPSSRRFDPPTVRPRQHRRPISANPKRVNCEPICCHAKGEM